MKICYHAGGYVGLTGALHYAKAGLDVVIFDPDHAVVEAINAGTPKAGSFLGYLGGEALRCGTQVKATSHIDAVLDADAHFLAVPSERNGEPAMDIVLSVFKTLCDATPPRVPIIVESTLMPGMAKELRDIAGFRPWAIAPRRDWFADASKNLETLTRIVGRDTQHHDVIASFITPVCRDIHWTTPETAELTKAMENALLHLPVMLLHELALLYPEYDIVEAAELASTHWRFRSLGKLYLGLGTGGRCVPLGSKYLGERGGALLGDATELDEQFASEALMRCLYDTKGIDTALVLGVAYRPGFKDAGNSPGLRAATALRKVKEVFVYDPLFTEDELEKMIAPAAVWTLGLPAPDTFDLVVLTVAHSGFADGWELFRPGVTVIDATGMWEGKRTDWNYIRPGRPGWIPTAKEK